MIRNSSDVSVFSVVSAVAQTAFALAFMIYLIINLNNLREYNGRVLKLMDFNINKQEAIRKKQFDELYRMLEDQMSRIDAKASQLGAKIDALQSRDVR